MTCDIRYDSPMMTELATFPPLFWFSLAVCMAVIVMIAALLRQYGCDIAYVTAWTNPFGRLPQILAVSALAVLVTGVALCVEKRRREVQPWPRERS